MAVVVWTKGALSDLHQIVDHIAEDSPANAGTARNRIIRATRALAANPRFGPRVPEFERDDLREVYGVPFRVIYWLDGQVDCHVVAVVRGARDLGQLLTPTELIDRAAPSDPLDD